MHVLLYLVVGLASGLVAGLFGLGGGVVLVPVLVTLGLPVAEAAGTSLVVVLVNASSGAFQHFRQGNVHVRRGLGMAAGALAGAPLGSFVADRLVEVALRAAYLALLVVTGLVLARRRGRAPRPAGRLRYGWPHGLAIGAAGGFLAGLFGVGGGIVLVPLQLALGVEMLVAVGTSLFAMIATAGIALGSHVILGNVHWGWAGLLALGGLVGAPVGGHLAQRLGNRRLRAAFAAAIGILALMMLIQTVRVL